MFRKLTRYLVLSLVLVLLMTSLTGLSALGEGSDVQGWGEEKMPLNIAVLTGFTQEGSEIQKMLEERYNIEITLTVLPGWTDGQSKVNLLMADETQRPDVIWWWGMEKEYLQWVAAGLLTDVREYWDKYPNIRGYYETTSPDSPFYSIEDSGSMFRIMGDVAEPCCMTLIVRQDWLDNLGLEVPTTLDEMTEVMRAFTFNDPDGNGVNDTYGIHGANELRSFTTFFSAFESIPDQFVRVGDEVKYGATQPETKEALAYLAGLYQEGLMNPDITIKDINYDEAFVRGGHGFTYRWIAYLNPQDTNVLSFGVSNPGGAWAQVDPISGPTGYASDRVEDPAAWCFFGITPNASDPERIYAIFDDMTSPEVYRTTRFGIEGRDYTYEDGIYTNLLTEDDNLANNIGRGLFGNFVNRKDAENITNIPEVVQAFAEGSEKSQSNRDRIVFFKADRPVWNSYKADIEALRDEYLWGIIAGQRPIEDFDTFVELFYATGGAEVEAEATEFAAAQDVAYQNYLDSK